jgi:hypothetical protein
VSTDTPTIRGTPVSARLAMKMVDALQALAVVG